MGCGEDMGEWTIDPLGIHTRPVMPCDLCTTVRIGGDLEHGSDVGAAPVHALVPSAQQQDGQQPPNEISTLDIRTAHRTREYRCELSVDADAATRSELASQIGGLIRREVLHEINTGVVEALCGVAVSSRSLFRDLDATGTWDAETYFVAASRVAEMVPSLQFPQEIVAVMPSMRLASLLAGRHDQSVTYWGDARSCTSVSGLDVISYNVDYLPHSVAEQHYDGPFPPKDLAVPMSALPAFAVPRRGSLGLALSHVAVRAERTGGQVCFTADYVAGIDVLWPDSIVGMVPTPARARR